MFKKFFSLMIAVALLCAACACAESDPSMVFDPGYRYLYGTNHFALMTYDQGEILYNAAGEALTAEGSYKQISAYSVEYFTVTGNDDKKGVINSEGIELVPVQYDAVYVRGDWALSFVYAEGDEDDYDETVERGDETTYLIYDKVDVYFLKDGSLAESADREAFAAFEASDSNLNIEDRDGGIRSYTAEGKLSDVSADYVEDFEWCKGALDVYYDDDDYLVGLCGANGKPLCDPIYSYIDIVPGADYFIVEDEDAMFGLISASGKEVVAPAYTEMLSVSYGVYEVCGVFAGLNDYDETLTLIDTVNDTEYTIDTNEIYDYTFDGCALMVTDEEDRCTLIAPDGTETSLPEGLEWVSAGYGIYTATDFDNNVVVAVNVNGEVVAEGGDVFVTPDGHMVVDNDEGLLVYEL